MPAYLESSTTTISAALRPIDTFTGGAPFGALRIGLVESERPAASHPEGFVLFADLPAGVFTVRVDGLYFYRHPALTFDPALLDPVAGALDLSLQPSPRYPFPATATLVRGFVHDSGGAPLGDVEVQVQGGGPVGRTNPAGEFVFFFSYSSSTAITIDFAKSGFAAATANPTVLPGETVTTDVAMALLSDPGTAVLVCTVRDPDGNPVSGALVEAHDYPVSAISGLNGKAVLPVATAASPEDVDVRIKGDGYAKKKKIISALQGQTTTFNANLNPATTADPTTLDLFITGIGGAPLTDALVEVIEFGKWALSVSGTGRALIHIDGIPPGDQTGVTVRVAKIGFVTKYRTLTLQIGKTITLGLNMTASA